MLREHFYFFLLTREALEMCSISSDINPSGWGVPRAPPTISYGCNSCKQHQANTALAAFLLTTEVSFQVSPRGNASA